jgi:hypothetical protein
MYIIIIIIIILYIFCYALNDLFCLFTRFSKILISFILKMA